MMAINGATIDLECKNDNAQIYNYTENAFLLNWKKWKVA